MKLKTEFDVDYPEWSPGGEIDVESYLRRIAAAVKPIPRWNVEHDAMAMPLSESHTSPTLRETAATTANTVKRNDRLRCVTSGGRLPPFLFGERTPGHRRLNATVTAEGAGGLTPSNARATGEPAIELAGESFAPP